MGIFEGLRVVEFASGMAGPLAGMMLADNGAEVIKVEPRGGDSARATAGFQMWNRGKKSVVLDLVDNARDAQRALDLANSADVLIEDYGHALPEGLSFDRLHESNVGLVHCSIRGFSIDSLDRTYASDEGVVAARSGRYLGLDGMSGSDADYAVHRPVFVAPPIGSYSSAMLAVMGISGALMQGELRCWHGDRHQHSGRAWRSHNEAALQARRRQGSAGLHGAADQPYVARDSDDIYGC